MIEKKKEKIYNVVLDLIEQKEGPANITLLDIANECNIGKSTLYEYFESKEELLYKAIFYHLNKCIENIMQIKGATTKEIFYDYLNKIEKMKKNYRVVLKSLLFSSFSKSSSTKEQDWQVLESKAREVFKSVNQKIIFLGQKEGIYRTDLEDFDYIFCQLSIVVALSTDEININSKIKYTKAQMYEKLFNKTLLLLG